MEKQLKQDLVNKIDSLLNQNNLSIKDKKTVIIKSYLNYLKQGKQ